MKVHFELMKCINDQLTHVRSTLAEAQRRLVIINSQHITPTVYLSGHRQTIYQRDVFLSMYLIITLWSRIEWYLKAFEDSL